MTFTACRAHGAFTFVEEGSSQANNGYVLVTADAITVGSTDMAFEQFSGAGQIEAGAGIKKNGNELFLSFGAGVVELPSGEIGLDLASDSGMMLSVNGSSPSTDTADGKASSTSKRFERAPPPVSLLLKSVIFLSGGGFS